MYLYIFLKILNFHVTQETGDIEIGKVAINLKNHEDCLRVPRIASEFSLDIISQAHGYFKLIHPTLADAKLKPPVGGRSREWIFLTTLRARIARRCQTSDRFQPSVCADKAVSRGRGQIWICDFIHGTNQEIIFFWFLNLWLILLVSRAGCSVVLWNWIVAFAALNYTSSPTPTRVTRHLIRYVCIFTRERSLGMEWKRERRVALRFLD